MSNYTKGEWRLSFRGSQTEGVNVCFSIHCEKRTEICGGQSQEHLGEGYIHEDECRANAHLLHAAKDLFEALQELTDRVERIVLADQSTPDTSRAHFALAKALGEVDQTEHVKEAA